MNSGIGTDIIEIGRIQAAIERHGQRFLDRVFTPAEQTYCEKRAHPATHYAGRFAAKEAVSKAAGGIYRWQDIEITNNSVGRPVALYDGKEILISMSHCKEYATAVAWIP